MGIPPFVEVILVAVAITFTLTALGMPPWLPTARNWEGRERPRQRVLALGLTSAFLAVVFYLRGVRPDDLWVIIVAVVATQFVGLPVLLLLLEKSARDEY